MSRCLQQPLLEVAHPLRALRRDEVSRSGKTTPAKRPEVAEEAGGGGGLRCVQCGNLVTTRDQQIEIDGRFEHVFTNPFDLQFRLGCFAAATGCTGVGEITEAYTWFPGYAWQMAVCRQCGNHLGWEYRGSGHAFWGLILSRLVDDRRAE